MCTVFVLRASGVKKLTPGTSRPLSGFYISPTSSEPPMTLTIGQYSTSRIFLFPNSMGISRVWEAGGYASKGLTEVAKWGSPRVLESELKASSRHIRTIIKARGLWYPNVNGKTFAIFRADSRLVDKSQGNISLNYFLKISDTTWSLWSAC